MAAAAGPVAVGTDDEDEAGMAAGGDAELVGHVDVGMGTDADSGMECIFQWCPFVLYSRTPYLAVFK